MKWALIILMVWPNGNVTATATVKPNAGECADVRDLESAAAFAAAKYYSKHKGTTEPSSYKAICGPLVEE